MFKIKAGGLGVSALEERLAEEPHSWDHLLKNLAIYQLQVQLPQLSLGSHLNLRDAIRKVSTPSSNFPVRNHQHPPSIFSRTGCSWYNYL